MKIRNDGATSITCTASNVVEGNFNETSDIALKKDISTMSSGLNFIKQLRPVNFKWRKGDKYSSGFIAQEINAVIPELRKPGYRRVYKDNITYDGNAVDKDTFVEVDQVIYGRPAFNAYLVKAIQELSAKVTALESA